MAEAARSPPAPTGPGRRYLTILFSDLTESTKMAVAMEAEHYAALLSMVRQVYQDTVLQHGGLVVRVQGDGLLALFGYPDAHEDDGRRAVETALDLHRAVQVLRPEMLSPAMPTLNLHTGIHSGLVLVEAGDIERGRFELLGPVPNIAARLSQAAEAGAILVSEETLGPARHFFQSEQPVRIPIKGRDAPLLVHPVQARAAIATRFEARAQRGLAPFVGRKSEMARLEQGLRAAMDGLPRYLAVSAAAGLGKTRLTDEFLRRAAERHCQIHRGYCESYLSAEPLQPFLQILRALFKLRHGTSAEEAGASVDTVLRQIDPALRVHRGEYLRALSLGGPGAQRAAPETLILALRELFSSLARAQPVVLFIDDWQWADDASSQALAAIRTVDHGALLILLATRGFEAGDSAVPAAPLIELAPFTEQEAAAAISQLLPRADPFVATEVSRYAGGNPLFLEELCHSAARGDSPRRPGVAHQGAAWLNQLIESRVLRLPHAQAELVRAAAVIGNVIPIWLLERITGRSENDPMVLDLAEQDFIFPGKTEGTLRFKHGITRDVIYESVGLHARRDMHLRTAESLLQQGALATREEAYETLAYHFAAGGSPMQAAHYAELAGDKAIAASALDRAHQQYRAALDALDLLAPGPERSRRWLSIAQRLGMVCVFDAQRKDLAIFERGVALATELGDAASIARATYWLGYISYSLGDPRAAVHHCELALEAARRAGDEPLAVQIVATLGQAHTAAGSYERALKLLDEAIAVKRSHRSGRRTAVGLAFSLVCRASALGDRGQFALAHECFDEALACMLGITHEIGTSIHGWRSAVLLWQGDWTEARAAALESARSAELTRSLYQLAMARAMGGYADWMLDSQAAAWLAIADATAWLQPREGGLFRSLNHGWLADIFVTTGQHGNARQQAALALQRGRRRDLIGVAMAYRALARLAAGAGKADAVKRYLQLAMQVARERDSAHEIAVNQLCEAGIALARDGHAHALRLLDEAQAAFERMGMAWHLRESQALRALAG